MRKEIPLLITFLTGMYFVVDYFVTIPGVERLSENMKQWVIIIIAFTYILGVGNVAHFHLRKVARQERDWLFSVATLISMVVMIVLGMIYPGTMEGTAMVWLYNHIFTPMQATMFSLLAFYIASASFRAFRVRNVEASLLAITALVVMMGRVPLGDMLWGDFAHFVEWIMGDLQVVGKRAILIGAALGAISTGLKVILGIERSYLSGE